MVQVVIGLAKAAHTAYKAAKSTKKLKKAQKARRANTAKDSPKTKPVKSMAKTSKKAEPKKTRADRAVARAMVDKGHTAKSVRKTVKTGQSVNTSSRAYSVAKKMEGKSAGRVNRPNNVTPRPAQTKKPSGKAMATKKKK
jgi:hypothetical protein